MSKSDEKAFQNEMIESLVSNGWQKSYLKSKAALECGAPSLGDRNSDVFASDKDTFDKLYGEMRL